MKDRRTELEKMNDREQLRQWSRAIAFGIGFWALAFYILRHF